LKTASTKDSTARRPPQGLLAVLIAALALFGGAQMIAAAPAGAWLAECDEEVSCTGDGGGGGPATGNSGGGGQDGSGGDQGALDPCYVDPGPNCWGSTDSGSQGQGSSGSSNSNSGGSSGTASDDLCASWGVSCGTAQSGGGNGNGGFGAPDPTLPAFPPPGARDDWDSLHLFRTIDCNSHTDGTRPHPEDFRACMDLQQEIPSQNDCYPLKRKLARSLLPARDPQHRLMSAEWNLCESELDFVEAQSQCVDPDGRSWPFKSPAEEQKCGDRVQDKLGKALIWMILVNRAKDRLKTLERPPSDSH
jgi:hypothetical protein